MLGQFGTIVMGFAYMLWIGHHNTLELAAAGIANQHHTHRYTFKIV